MKRFFQFAPLILLTLIIGVGCDVSRSFYAINKSDVKVYISCGRSLDKIQIAGSDSLNIAKHKADNDNCLNEPGYWIGPHDTLLLGHQWGLFPKRARFFKYLKIHDGNNCNLVFNKDSIINRVTRKRYCVYKVKLN